MPGSDAIELKGGGVLCTPINSTFHFILDWSELKHVWLPLTKKSSHSDSMIFFFPIVTKNFKLCSFQILILISYRLGGEKKNWKLYKKKYTQKILQMWLWMCTSRKRKVRFTGDTVYTHSYNGNSLWKRLWSKRNSSSGTREKQLCVQLLHHSSKLRNNTLQDFL